MILNFNALDYTAALKDQIRAALATVIALDTKKTLHFVLDASDNLYRCETTDTYKVWRITHC